MLYFKKNNDVIEKYEIDFDKEEIENLRLEIIDNCSLVEHKVYQGIDLLMSIDKSLIKNFSSTKVGEKEYFEETKDVYLYKYDEYKPPYLVKLIDRLLENDSSVLGEIFNYDAISSVSIDDKINLASEEFAKIDPQDTRKRLEKLKELENLLRTKELNVNVQSVYLYYIRLLALIQIELIDKISISDIRKIEEFLEVKLTDKVAIDKGRSLKKVK